MINLRYFSFSSFSHWSLSLNHYFVYTQDPSNLQGKVQKHQAFEAELSANQSRIDALQKSGQELIDGKHYASSEVTTRMDEVSSQWKKLLEATELKGKLHLCSASLQIIYALYVRIKYTAIYLFIN